VSSTIDSDDGRLMMEMSRHFNRS